MRTRNNLFNGCFVLIAFLTFLAASVRADVDVAIRASGFNPASVTVAPDEWVWFIVMDDNDYVVQSYTGAWQPWYLFGYGDGFGLSFNEPGDYWYRDIYTWHSGVIHVRTGGGGKLPPTVTIDAPADGAVFTEPASFDFVVSANDPENNLGHVELSVAGTTVQTLYSPPFATHVSGLTAGDYQLTAIAYDNLGAAASSSINITVRAWIPPQVSMSQPRFVAGEFQFEASGLPVGNQVVLQSGNSLDPNAAWTSISTNQVTGDTMSFNQPAIAGTHFYRLLLMPYRHLNSYLGINLLDANVIAA